MKFFIIILLLFSLGAYAGVNLKNGNFYISYTDIVVPGGNKDLKYSRTYNSTAIRKGWSGIGWGNVYETFLVVGADGSVTVHENGSGAETRFTPRGSVNAAAAAKKIVDTMRKRGSTLSASVAKGLINKLKNDAEMRQAYAIKFKAQAQLPKGSVLYSSVRGLQEIVKLKKGFKRTYNNGKSEFFNEAGQLEKIVEKSGFTVNLTRKAGKLVSIKDSGAKQLFFDWYHDGKLKSCWSLGDKKATYKYSGDDLIESVDVAGNVYKYKYDENHNLKSISYSNGTSLKVDYTPKSQFVKLITEPNGDTTKYKYGSNPKNPKFHYWTTVTRKRGEEKERKNRFEYEIKAKPDGSSYTYRTVQNVNGIKTETIYSECCSLPIKISRGKNTTTFKYNNKGLLVEKNSQDGRIKLAYNQKFNKISRVDDSNKGWTTFAYDKRGNLSRAINSSGKEVQLFYDRKGRITKMKDLDKMTKKTRALHFRYNALGKPVKITMEKMGSINVAYDNFGDIKKVESKAGNKMALQVTQAFQNLLSIVKPAGVNLNL